MDDIAPEILESIKKTFNKALSTDSTIKRARTALKEGKATYNDANYLSQRYGELLSRSIQLNVSADILPDGRMYYNIADKILRPLLEMDHDEIANYCADVQTRLNEISGVGLKGLKADLNRSKVDGFIDKVSSAEKYDDVKWMVGEPIVNFSQSIVDDSIKKNAEFQYNSGLRPRVIRTAEANCCDWCSELEGEYEYPNVPREVFQRHENCRCEVVYDGSRLRSYNRNFMK